MLSEKLKQLRRDKNINQTQFARELDVSQATVAKWESGTHSPDVPTLRKIARFFEVNFDWLLEDDSPGNDELILLTRQISALPDSQKSELIDRLRAEMDSYLKIRGCGND